MMKSKGSLTTFPLLPAFFLSFLPLLLFPLFLPSLRLTYFAPFIVLTCYKKKVLGTLWISSFCGLCLDLFSTTPCFGFCALNYSLCALLLYSQTRNFFEDQSSTLPFMTFLFALLSTFLQVLFFHLMGEQLSFSFQWVFSDFLFMPLLDAAYSFIWFLIPIQIYRNLYKFIKYHSLRKSRN